MLGHHEHNPYFRFTDQVNINGPVAILASGQACVWYQLTLASKDGDWIVREDVNSLEVIRNQLEAWGAHYRLGAPLDARWLAAGWSSHFEAEDANGTRLRFDFVSRPPRLSLERLRQLWVEVDTGNEAVIPREDLIPLKQTMRLKDYAFIGGLALQLTAIPDQIRWTLDAQHLLDLLTQYPTYQSQLDKLRPACANSPMSIDALDECIDRETRQARRRDEMRIAHYSQQMAPWAQRFREIDVSGLSLSDAHTRYSQAAEDILPTEVHIP